MGPLISAGVGLPEVFAASAVVAAVLCPLSLAVAHRQPSPATIHPGRPRPGPPYGPGRSGWPDPGRPCLSVQDDHVVGLADHGGVVRRADHGLALLVRGGGQQGRDGLGVVLVLP